MGYLERLFLGTMLLVGLLILFLFGLYFDIGNMIIGTVRPSTIPIAQDMLGVRERRKALYADEQAAPVVRSQPAPVGFGTVAQPSTPINWDRFLHREPPVSKDVLVDRERRRLKRKGFVDEEYIQMQAIYEVDRSMVPVFDRYDQLVEAGDYEAAIAALLEAKDQLDKSNVLALRDLLQYLGQAYVLAGKEKEASANLRELMNAQEQVLAIEQRAELHQDSQGKEYVAKLQENFGHLREALDKMDNAPPGYENPLSHGQNYLKEDGKIVLPEEAKRLMQAELMKRVGQGGEDGISQQEFDEIMQHVEVGGKGLGPGH